MFKGLWRGSLGVLEREVMDAVWTAGEVTVRDAQSRLPRRVAYTTVMTTLDRLFKKGLVLRTRAGKAFVYRAAGSRQQTEAAMASGVVTGLLAGGAAMPILSNLVDAVGRHEDAADLLDALEQMVRDTRRRLEQDDGPDRSAETKGGSRR
jgi:predicted transcriptional regulator